MTAEVGDPPFLLKLADRKSVDRVRTPLDGGRYCSGKSAHYFNDRLAEFGDHMKHGTMLIVIALASGLLCLPWSTAVPILDGTIGRDEYGAMMTFGGGKFNLHWSLDGDEVYFALQGETTGWVALGLEPTRAMQDADMLMGWVEGGRASVLDAFSTGAFGPHPPDTDLGGSSDILDFAGSERNGITTIELKRKLSTRDRYDKAVATRGTMSIIWAVGRSDSYLTKHADAGSGVISMEIHELLPGLYAVSLVLAFKRRREPREGGQRRAP